MHSAQQNQQLHPGDVLLIFTLLAVGRRSTAAPDLTAAETAELAEGEF